MTRLVRLILAAVLIGLASMLLVPVLATVLTPGWISDADVRDWAGMTFFLALTAAFLLVALRLAFRGAAAGGVLRSGDWWVIAALSIVAAVGTAIAAHWMIALPGLIPIGGAALMARRRRREERFRLVESEVVPGN